MDLNTHDAIAKRAYQIWQQEGCPGGRELDHWLDAEAQISSARAGKPAKARAPRRSPARTSPKRHRTHA